MPSHLDLGSAASSSFSSTILMDIRLLGPLSSDSLGKVSSTNFKGLSLSRIEDREAPPPFFFSRPDREAVDHSEGLDHVTLRQPTQCKPRSRPQIGCTAGVRSLHDQGEDNVCVHLRIRHVQSGGLRRRHYCMQIAHRSHHPYWLSVTLRYRFDWSAGSVSRIHLFNVALYVHLYPECFAWRLHFIWRCSS